MKTLIEIQQELDDIIQKAKTISVDEIIQRIRTVSGEIAEIEEANRPVDNLSVDIEEIMLSTVKNLYIDHAIKKEDDTIKRKYLILLFSGLFAESVDNTDALAYACRVAKSGGYNDDIRELYSRGLNLTPAELKETINSIKGKKLAEVLMVDMLIMSEMYMTDKTSSRKYADKLFSLLELDTEQIDFVIAFVKVLITGDANDYSGSRKFLDDEFSCYINDNKALKDSVEEMRSVFYMHLRPFTFKKEGYDLAFLTNSFQKLLSISDIDVKDNKSFSVRLKTESDFLEKHRYSYKVRYPITKAFLNRNTFCDVLDMLCENSKKKVEPLVGEYNGKIMLKDVSSGRETDVELSKVWDLIKVEEPCLFEPESGQIERVWNPAVGYFHSPLDLKSRCESWYSSQPKNDPEVGSMDLERLNDIAMANYWRHYYEVIEEN